MAFDPSTAKPMMSFDPSTARPMDATKAPAIIQTQTSQDESNPLVNPGTAAIAGLAHAGANVGEGVADLGVWIANKLGIIGDDTRDKAYDALKKGSDEFRPQQGDILDRSYEKYPMYGAVPQAATEVLSAVKGASPAWMKIGGKLGSIANVGAQTLGNIGATVASSSTQEERDKGAMIAGLATPGLYGTGAGLAKIGSKGTLKDKLASIVEDLNKDLDSSGAIAHDELAGMSVANKWTAAKEVENQGYQAIRDIEGTINNKPIINSLDKLIKTQGSYLEKNQLGILQDFSEQAKNLNNMEDAIKLRQNISQTAPSFSPKTTNNAVSQSYKELKTLVDDQISTKAAKAGLGDKWSEVNKFHTNTIAPLQEFGADKIAKAVANKETDPNTYASLVDGLIQTSPLKVKALIKSMDEKGAKIISDSIINKTFQDIIANPESFNLSKALVKTNKTLNDYKHVLPEDSLNALRGIKDLMKSSGVRETLRDSRSTLSKLTPTLVKAAIPPILKDGIPKLLNTPRGRFILQGIGTKAPWAEKARSLILKSLQLAPIKAISQISSPTMPEEQVNAPQL